MDNYAYDSVTGYFNILHKLGYYNYKDVYRLLVLLFFYNLTFNDYRGYISKKDYHIIEKALNCLYGTNCLIPYPDYLKMGKLKLGQITEVAQRVRNLENTEVLKLIHNLDSAGEDPQSDIKIEAFDD